MLVAKLHSFRLGGLILRSGFRLALVLWGLAHCGGGLTAAEVDFVRDVQPIFRDRCYKCHSAELSKSGLRLDSKRSALEGGDSGKPGVVPGDVSKSHILLLVKGAAGGEIMPPKGEPLTSVQIATLTTWVEAGAPWPESLDKPGMFVPKHWAFRKPMRPVFPALKDSKWPRNGIDPFILSKLETEKLKPAEEADAYTLVRRLSLDLTGLPPTPDEVDAFVADLQPGAYERLVDRYLASPALGERWARVWLDLARYADSKGYGSDPLRPYMWRYRDWVIEAFNRNLPYDQFTVEQLAGDLLPHPTGDQLLATAFHRNTMVNDEGGTDDEEFRVAAIKDRIDTTLQVWMGLTFGCAKCHSHKYDPITQKEYYAFYAFFNQTADADRPDDTPRIPTPTQEQQQQLDALRHQLEPLLQQREHPTLDFSLAQSRWEARARQVEREWTALSPARGEATEGTELYLQPDATLVALGPSGETNQYSLHMDQTPSAMTGLRLQILPVAGGGPDRLSRQPRGPVQLANFSASVHFKEAKYPSARIVRIELPGKSKYLSLAEVEVWSGRTNLALSGIATQSTTDFEGAAPRAIDGKTNGDYEAKSVTHTAASDNPWWEVDLGQSQSLERVVVWNRTDPGVGNRLAGFRVILLDDQRQPIATEQPSGPPDRSVSISLGGDLPIRFKRVSASSSRPGFAASQCFDGDPKTAWMPQDQPPQWQELIFTLAAPLTLEPGATLILRLQQNGGPQGAIARFSVAATSAIEPLTAMPPAIRSLVGIAAQERSEPQNLALTEYYWSLTPEYQVLSTQIERLEAQQAAIDKEVVRTPVLEELSPEHQRLTRVLLKGNFLSPGDPVRPAVPEAFHAFPSSAPTNRLGVAKWIVDVNNPLTARVAVNRFWAALFSRGLVESEEDFGTQGLAPSHPELLDWLATEFIRIRWDTKALLKLMVTSSTYRQSSRVSQAALQTDPRNLWLSRSPRPRLEAEMVRDQALALSGLLSKKHLGPSVYPPQPTNLWQAAFNGERTWTTSTGEDKYRRGLYTFWRRTVPYPSMLTFDAPSREYCTIRRIPSNTPLQAFVTLNDPVFVEAAQALARRIQQEGGDSVEARIRYGLKLVCARPAQDQQVAPLVALFQSGLLRFEKDAESAKQLAGPGVPASAETRTIAETAAWTVVANVLLNLDAVLTKG